MSIAGSWLSVPGQGSLWPEQHFSKNGLGWNLFGHAIRSGSGMGLPESDVNLLIDPSLNQLTWKFASNFSPQEFPLDGTEKEYVPQIFSSTKGLWQCISRSNTEIRALMQPQLSDSSGFAMIVVTVQLQENGEQLKVDMEYKDNNTTHTHYFQRALPGGSRPAKLQGNIRKKKSLAQLPETKKLVRKEEKPSAPEVPRVSTCGLAPLARKIMWWRASKPANT
eukprot:CAMPEP_0197669516 /NCGR_PEP_ID=MMETSP1338-20131121/72185_1 /TAXON_ID=43686 ORGANISM="Pelagodinium beii, Strain RCC1491" /NCGR_SAMPLE_ID=MMETSP1338 /ASSEMBLY_ACC=CAM_ASM_000754 /LENGTH=221 /DNA_ID=CAMNT_0043249093 /DNA_START=72 /DNA_END=737 /DNA_ORIENTATION=+